MVCLFFRKSIPKVCNNGRNLNNGGENLVYGLVDHLRLVADLGQKLSIDDTDKYIRTIQIF